MSTEKKTDGIKTEEMKKETVAESELDRQMKSVKAVTDFPKCYVGPSFVGANKGSVYKDALPPALSEVIEDNPVLGALVVPVSKLAAVNVALENPGSSLSKVYERAQIYLKNMRRE